VSVHEAACSDEQRTCAVPNEGRKGWLDLAVAADIESDELPPDRLRRSLHVAPFRFGFANARAHEHRDCRRLGHELVQQLQSLRPYRAAEKTHAGDVAARTIEARDEAVRDWVAPRREDNRHGRRCGLGGERRHVVRDDHGHAMDCIACARMPTAA
jgi:hypothetical protein